MCGILGVKIAIVNKELFDNLFYIYFKQRDRGTNGCGLALNRNGVLSRIRGTNADDMFTKEEFLDVFKNLQTNDMLIMHHRYPTTGGSGNITTSNHPIANEDKSLMLIHNGCLNNYVSKYLELCENNHSFETEIRTVTKDNKIIKTDITDSEIIVHTIEKNISNITKIDGSIAIAFFRKGKNKIYLYKDGNPIVVYKDADNNIYFSSEFHNEDNRFELISSLSSGVFYCIGVNDNKNLRWIRRIKEKVMVNYKPISKIVGQSSLNNYQSNDDIFNWKEFRNNC